MTEPGPPTGAGGPSDPVDPRADPDRPATDARGLARGAVFNYAAQIGTVLVQLGYAAVTSRLLDPHLFGVLAAATTSAVLVNVLAMAGLPQIVGRMPVLEANRLVGLLAYAMVVGVAGALVLAGTAGLWASLWKVADAESVIRLLAIGAFFAPLVAFGNGLLARTGRFRTLALVTFLCNAGGMVIGVVVVLALRSAESLAVAQIVGQGLIALFGLFLSRSLFRGGRARWAGTVSDVHFSAKSIVAGVLVYVTNAVPKLAVSRGFGTITLGNWNRAEAITTTPFYLLGMTMLQVVYPEFRHDRGAAERTRRVWSDLLGIVGWVCLPLSAFVAVISPLVVQLLFGQQWGEAERMAPVLAIVGGVQPLAFLLVSGFEALGRFRWLWAGYGVSIAVNAAGAIAAISTGSIGFVFAGLLAGHLTMHVFHLIVAVRAGLVSVGRVARHYSEIAGFAIAIAAVTYVAVHAAELWQRMPWLVAASAVFAVVAGILLVRFRERFPPVRLARAYGLLQH